MSAKYGDTPEATKAEIADLKRLLAVARLERDLLDAQVRSAMKQIALMRRAAARKHAAT
jgi:hypothetical protein